MPQPFDPQKARRPIIDRSCAVLSRPKCAALIAAIASEWTRIEHSLADLIGAATGTSQPILFDGYQTNSWRTEPNIGAQAAFRAAETIHAKITAFERAWEAVGFPENLKRMREDVFRGLRARAKERNQIVHAVWAVVDDYPEDVLRKDISGEFVRYTLQDLREIVARLLDLQNVLFEFHIQCTGNNAGLKLSLPFNYAVPSD